MEPNAARAIYNYPTSMELMLKQRRKFLLNTNTRWHGQKDARR